MDASGFHIAQRRYCSEKVSPGQTMAVTVAATQMHCTWDLKENVQRAEALIREAVAMGAQIVLLQELFETPYFCIDARKRHLTLARPRQDHPTIRRLQTVARELQVVLPVSFFERADQAYFNALVVIDANGAVVGHYRKSHIPDAPGYEEKFYFSPGDTGFQSVPTRYARIGVAICWDQWFPEAARIMALQGAELLFYPTAIGSEIGQSAIDSRDHWRTVMQGHSAANIMPVIAANRIGTEHSNGRELTFYGSSFVTDHCGTVVAGASRDREEVVTATFDLSEIAEYRRAWGVFRDRRPDLYGPVCVVDGIPGAKGG